jgi:hypothetical protein
MTSPGADSNLCYYSPVTQMQMRMQMRSTGFSLVRCLTSGLVLSCVPLAAREDEEIPLTALVKALQLKGGKTLSNSPERVVAAADVTLPDASSRFRLASRRSCRLPVTA